MTPHSTGPDHSPDDARLAALLAHAVDDVEPADRLAAVRRRTHDASAARARRRWYGVGGGAALVAASAVVVALVTQPDADRGADVAGDPTRTPSSPGPVEPPSGPPVPVYYVGDGPDGPDAPEAVLYRYFERSGSTTLDLLTGTPSDPDYRTMWPAGSLLGVTDPEAGLVQVTVAEGLGDRPEGMSAREAELAVQQVVYTVRAVHQDDLAVRFRLEDGSLLDQVLGVPTDEPVTAAPQLEVLSHLSISDPAEGLAVTGALQARGVASSFEGTVFCRLLDDGGDAVWQQAATARGGILPDRLTPWRLRVDLTGVPAGTYLFTCATDDPTAGAEGRGTDTDTRSIVVE